MTDKNTEVEAAEETTVAAKTTTDDTSVTKTAKAKSNDKDKDEDEIVCVWDMGTPCDDTPDQKRLMFSKQLDIPICDKHFEEHKEVMILVSKGYDIEEVVDMTPEERKRLTITVVLSGMSLDDVEV